MHANLEAQKQATLSAAVRLMAAELPESPRTTAIDYISTYFGRMDSEDLTSRSAEDLCGAALAHLSFARTFLTGTPALRVYNPRLDEHGWSSPHTVIEIVNDDMPFLVDSVTMEVNRQGYTLLSLTHPLFRTQRDAAGQLLALVGEEAEGTQESFIHLEVSRETEPERMQALGDGVLAILADVRAAVADWSAMRDRLQSVIGELANPPAGLPRDEAAEAVAFLQWVNDHHFTFLGFREYELIRADGTDWLQATQAPGLGILRDALDEASSPLFNALPPGLRKLAMEPRPLLLSKSTSRATVHRHGYLDHISIKRFNPRGEVVGEWRFLGLYSSTAYREELSEIPLLRKKAAAVLARAGFSLASHMGRNLVNVLETYPRDELFQLDETPLLETALAILQLADRPRCRVFLRRDVFGRFFSCLIYLPREKFSTEISGKIENILKEALGGTSAELAVQLTDTPLARIHMLVQISPRDDLVVDPRSIEARIVSALHDWADTLKAALIADAGEEQANRLAHIYGNAFPVAYRESHGAAAAVQDIAIMERLSPEQAFGMSLYRPADAGSRMLRLRLYRLGQPLPLSGSLPMLENMGVSVEDEQSYALERDATEAVHIHDFGMTTTVDLPDIAGVKPLFEDALSQVGRREIENDGFNRLVLAARLSADEIILLRAIAKYLKQAGFAFSQSYIEQAFVENGAIARLLVDFFHARFDPALDATGGNDRSAAQEELAQRIEQALNDVVNADEDRTLRRILAVMHAAIRTNFYQRVDGPNGQRQRKPYLSIKFASARVPELPEPRPLYEIWVYSPRIEGIHLRGGKVARGGLRWSDRMEDFRTEVLGLVKAQMVKNAVIVPVGSKGCFVVKNAPPASDREACMQEGIACYKNFLRGLLDITDNLVANRLTPPKDVVRHDDDDPYLVVAADKGTATFSDFANAVSEEYTHWLGDAFASGGSVGYDHKKMGITARGTWESVKRHFLEIGVDTQTTDFTVVGVGDMSGDVFGNGMLLSRHIKLLAAFDHRHIFLDPTPDAETSFRERERMFNLPRSSWDDYDKSLISAGGGVYPRSAKSIDLTPEVKKALDIDADSVTPVELMRAILKAPVDLFYNGGIGTYIKASSQSNAEVGDRANDVLRVNGKELRCKVVGEGGNLGCTQLGRIEFALHGGRVYTDAIDNSAGVDCSDHEVNIKILLGIVEADGDMTEAQRNSLLAEMTDEVGTLVLADNYYQTQSLSVSGVRGEKMLDAQARFIRHLEKLGRLNRAVEFLPSDDEIAERRSARIGLTAPERAVLLAYSKMVLFDQLVLSDLIDDPYVAQGLIDYFPAALRERFAPVMARHPLKREIIATMITNSTINHVGSTFIFRMQEETGAAPHEVVRAYLMVRDIFGFSPLWAEIEALDRKVSAQVQNGMLIDAGRLLLRATLWFLRRHHEGKTMAQTVADFRPPVEQLRNQLPALLDKRDLDALRKKQVELQAAGVPARVAEQVAGLDGFYAALDIIAVAYEQGRSVDSVASVYFALLGKLEMRWLANQISALPTETHWQALARNAMRDDLASQQRLITTAVFRIPSVGDAPGDDTASPLAAWERLNAVPLSRLNDMVTDFRSGPAPDLAMLSVLLRELRSLA